MSILAYYALHKLHIRPSEWLRMHHREKAFIIASILHRVEDLQRKRK